MIFYYSILFGSWENGRKETVGNMRERCVSFMDFFVFLNKNLLFFKDFVKKKKSFRKSPSFSCVL